jgi:preprotein translocase subunit SecE
MYLHKLQELVGYAKKCEELYKKTVHPEEWGCKRDMRLINHFLSEIKKLVVPARKEVSAAKTKIIVSERVKKQRKMRESLNKRAQRDEENSLV